MKEIRDEKEENYQLVVVDVLSQVMAQLRKLNILKICASYLKIRARAADFNNSWITRVT